MVDIISADLDPHSGVRPSTAIKELRKLIAASAGLGAASVEALEITNAHGGKPDSIHLRMPKGATSSNSLEFFLAFQKQAGFIDHLNVPSPVYHLNTTDISFDSPGATFPTESAKLGAAGVQTWTMTPLGNIGGSHLITSGILWMTAAYQNFDDRPKGFFGAAGPGTYPITPAFLPGSGFDEGVRGAMPGLGSVKGFSLEHAKSSGKRAGFMTVKPLVNNTSTSGLIIPDQKMRIKADGNEFLVKWRAGGNLTFVDQVGSQGALAQTVTHPDGWDAWWVNCFAAVKQGDDGAGPGGEDLISLYPMLRGGTTQFDYALTVQGTAL